MAATLTQIAQEVGVSVSLVSRLVRNDPTLRVSDRKRKEILAVKNKLGGVKQNRSVLMLAHNIVVPVSRKRSGEALEQTLVKNPCMKSFEEALKAKGFHLSVNLYAPDYLFDTINDLCNSPNYCDGILFLRGVFNEKVSRLILDRGFPHVGMHQADESLGGNTVLSSCVAAMSEAISHLRELGHKRIGYIGPRKPRCQFFCAGLTELGMEIDESFNCLFPHPPDEPSYPHWTSEIWVVEGRKAFGKWLDGERPATGFVCHNDMVAFGAIEAMKQRGLVPGKDISIIGYDNIEQRALAVSGEPILTTIDNPLEFIGQRCVTILLHQILDKQRQIVHEHVPTRFILRKTTGLCLRD